MITGNNKDRHRTFPAVFKSKLRKCRICGKDFVPKRDMTIYQYPEEDDPRIYICDTCLDSGIIPIENTTNDPNYYQVQIADDVLDKAIEVSREYLGPRETFTSDEEYSKAICKVMEVFIKGYKAGRYLWGLLNNES